MSAAEIEVFLSGAGEREPDLRQLHAIIEDTVPGFKPVIMTGMNKPMVGYGMMSYTNRSGKSMDWPVIALANQKNYISLYISAVEDGEYVAEKYADTLGTVSVGKSCVRFKKLEDLKVDVLKELLRRLQDRIANGEAVFGI